MVRPLRPEEVDFLVEVFPEEVDFVGNCSAIDDETDRQAEDRIREELGNGNVWAWATVRVVARWEDFEGTACLGCCSYAGEESFRQCGYFDDLKAEALADLNDQVQGTARTLARLAQ